MFTCADIPLTRFYADTRGTTARSWPLFSVILDDITRCGAHRRTLACVASGYLELVLRAVPSAAHTNSKSSADGGFASVQQFDVAQMMYCCNTSALDRCLFHKSRESWIWAAGSFQYTSSKRIDTTRKFKNTIKKACDESFRSKNNASDSHPGMKAMLSSTMSVYWILPMVNERGNDNNI